MNLEESKLKAELNKLDEIEKAWTEKLDKDIKSEEDLIKSIDDITNNLLLAGKTRAIVNDKKFIIGSKVTNIPQAETDPVTGERKRKIVKTVILIVTDENRYTLLKEKYIPAMIKADYDERFDARANVRTAVEGWIRHITNTIKPEMLGE